MTPEPAPDGQLRGRSMLRDRGLRVTAQRLAVLDAVQARPHGTASEVAETVRGEIGAISRQSVHDTLTVLADHGIVRRIQPAGSPTRYEDRVGDNHHHLVCRRCDRMVDVDCAVDYTPCLTPAQDAGFAVDEAEVVYWGVCPACRAAAGPEPTTARQPTTTDRPTPPGIQETP